MTDLNKLATENKEGGRIDQLEANPLFMEMLGEIEGHAKAARAAHDNIRTTPDYRAEFLKLLLAMDYAAEWTNNRREENRRELIKRRSET